MAFRSPPIYAKTLDPTIVVLSMYDEGALKEQPCKREPMLRAQAGPESDLLEAIARALPTPASAA